MARLALVSTQVKGIGGELVSKIVLQFRRLVE